MASCLVVFIITIVTVTITSSITNASITTAADSSSFTATIAKAFSFAVVTDSSIIKASLRVVLYYQATAIINLSYQVDFSFFIII